MTSTCFYYHMATFFKTYTIVSCFLIILGYFYYTSQYQIATKAEANKALRTIDLSSNSKIREGIEQLNEDASKVVGDILELRGHYNETSGYLHKRIVRLNGLAELINQVTTLRDKTIEDSDYTDSKFFSEGRKVQDVDCSAVIRGDQREINRTKIIMKADPKKEISPKEYITLASNCSDFITARKYITSSLTEVERNFPIAFSLLMYTSVEQAERLLRAIYRPQNIYCIHVDKKCQADIVDAMKTIAGCFENVFIIKNSVDVKWGKFSVLEPELLCMKELWNRSTTWKYFINVAGQEFPLRKNYELVRILEAFKGANDVDGTIKRALTERWAGASPPPHGIIPIKGSVHVAASRGFIDYALHDIRAKDFLNWTRYVQIPDEVFFPSLNHNPSLGVPGAYKGIPETEVNGNIKPYVARFKNWGDGLYNWPCHGKWVRSICVFGIEDLSLMATRRELFANKFHIDYQPYGLDCLEELHYNHTRDEYLGKLSFDSGWYASLDFVKNKV